MRAGTSRPLPGRRIPGRACTCTHSHPRLCCLCHPPSSPHTSHHELESVKQASTPNPIHLTSPSALSSSLRPASPRLACAVVAKCQPAIASAPSFASPSVIERVTSLINIQRRLGLAQRLPSFDLSNVVSCCLRTSSPSPSVACVGSRLSCATGPKTDIHCSVDIAQCTRLTTSLDATQLRWFGSPLIYCALLPALRSRTSFRDPSSLEPDLYSTLPAARAHQWAPSWTLA